jgi:3-oxoacyl-[acyl-carrier-protein] synthase III
MATFNAAGVRIAAIASAVPGEASPVDSGERIPAMEFAKVVASTGVKMRHITPAGICTSDLCAAAANRVFERTGWSRESVDLVVLVTQTPDYILPSTACALHGRLGLAKHCAAFDINLGCSGYVYGLSLIATYIRSGAASRGLLLVGDTISKVVSQEDRSVAYLFGDAGTATALEKGDDVSMYFVTGSDGLGAGYLQIPAGMFRAPSSAETRAARPRDGGNIRSDEHLFMNGPEIFNFTIREVPRLIDQTLAAAGWQTSDVDAFVFHQANRYMLDYLAKRMKLPLEKVIFALESFGNTSSASIPVTICDRLRERLEKRPAKVVLAGFGVGFSWAAAAIELDRPNIEPVIRFTAST